MIQSEELQRMIRDGLIAPEAIACVDCGKPIVAGERALCDDGYVRPYGEFALSREGEEANWPRAHERCLPKPL